MGSILKNSILKAQQWAKAIIDGNTEDLNLNSKEREEVLSLQDNSYEQWREQHVSMFNQDETWDSLHEHITANKTSKKKGRSTLSLSIYRWASIAAILAIAFFFYNEFFSSQKTNVNTIEPGLSKAYLKIDNATTIDLTQRDSAVSLQRANITLGTDQLHYPKSADKIIKSEYHEIYVPQSAEFFLTLSDGTKVWLNSDTRIGFQSQFADNERIVHLKGEAYFEVAKNKNRPFKVKTSTTEIVVVGTEFNVKSYSDDENTTTTLSEGQVQVQDRLCTHTLNPGDQLIVNNNTGEHTKKHVNPELYSAWTKGIFLFKDERLEDIMKTISRWYGIEVRFDKAAIGDKLFSISLNRYEDISSLLELITATETIDYQFNDNVLIITKK